MSCYRGVTGVSLTVAFHCLLPAFADRHTHKSSSCHTVVVQSLFPDRKREILKIVKTKTKNGEIERQAFVQRETFQLLHLEQYSNHAILGAGDDLYSSRNKCLAR